jgi:hypothetical protein
MLAFTPPYQTHNGVTLLPDHADLRVRYVVPSAPQLCLTADGRPEFSLLQFLGGGAGAAKIAGGLLTFSAELTTPLADLRDLDFELRPVLFDAGIVELIALGVSSLSAVESGVPFKVTILGQGKPSLDSQNRVTFQLLLDANAAELVEKLLDAPDLPLVLIYKMQLSGLRPSYQISIEADWHKVYSNLQNRLNANAYYVAADVELTIEKALEENDIKIDTTIFGSEASDRSSAESARKQLLDWVLQRMFEPLMTTEPTTAETIGDTVDNVLFSLVRAVVPGVSYKLRALTQEQTRHFNIRMDETVAERRDIVPQGTLGALFRSLQVDRENRPNPAWPPLRDSLVQKVNLNGFPRIEVAVAVEDRFANDGVARIDAELRRPDGSATKSFTFRAASEKQTYIVNLLGATNPFDLPYQYRGTVHFDPTHRFGAHAPVQTTWQDGRSADQIIEPRLAYAVETIQVLLPPTFQFDQFAAVVVDLAYGDQTTRLTFSDTAAQTWRFRHFEPQRPAYRYSVRYLRPAAADANDIVLPTAESSGDLLSLPHPAPDKRPLQILVNLPLTGVHVALLDIAYDDPAHGVTFEEQLELSADQRFIRKQYDIADGGTQELRYRLTIFSDQGLLEGEWRTTEDTRLVIDAHLLDHRVVTLRPVGGTLADNRLSGVRVLLQQRSADNSIRAERQIFWDGAVSAENWEFPLGDPPVKTVYAQLTFIDLNGFTNRLAWQATEASNLIVHLQNQTLSG